VSILIGLASDFAPPNGFVQAAAAARIAGYQRAVSKAVSGEESPIGLVFSILIQPAEIGT
jgi:hypothetical protein